MRNDNQKNERKTEREVEARLPRDYIGRAVLGTLAAVSVLSIALVAPGVGEAVRVWQWYDRNRHRRYHSPSYVRKVVERLEKQGKVKVFLERGKSVVRLTEKGRRELMKYQLQEKSLQKKHWDKKWRIIIFDIAERRRGVRDRARIDLQSFGFIKLQESVWVYPYECEEVVALLKAEYKIGNNLLYIVAGDIENDLWLKKKFHLEV